MHLLGALHLDLFNSESEPGRECAFLALSAFLVSFGFIRTSARLMRSPRVPWWPGSVSAGGVHIHHLVWGISLLLASGFAALVSDLYPPWWQVTSIGFGIGAGLTLDEFALWLRLEDVYWSREGRASIDAVALVTLLGALVVLGLRPFQFDQPGTRVGTVAGVALVALLAAIAFLKGRLVLGVISIFVPVVGLIACARLAKPDSPWARWRYRGARRHRMDRARERFSEGRPVEVLGERLKDAVGGAPSRD